MKRGLGATYRLQLGPGFGFADAAATTGYLAELGVEHCYLSPVAEAVPRSPHGYDQTDPTALRAELGGDAGFATLAAACARAGLGIVLDLVPNHLSTWPGGPWWADVLARGAASAFASIFDIDWAAGGGRVLLPLLDRPLDAAIAAGTVTFDPPGRNGLGGPLLSVGGLELPLAGMPRPGDRLEDVLGAQHYRLVDYHDRTARNYRRFFDIDGLVGVRVEDPEVFERTHALVRRLVETGVVAALRVDHVDGLAEPAAYLGRLRAATGGLPILVEKVLTGNEVLPVDWPVAGTTGYEVLDDLAGALVDPDGLEALAAAARAEGEVEPAALGVACRELAAAELFPAELGRLAAAFGVAPAVLARATARLPAYRTYLPRSPGRAADERAGLAVLTGATGDPRLAAAFADPARRAAVLAFQQLSGAVMAKGVEDTALYRLAGRLAFCEVGGDPGRDRHDGIARLHERAAARAANGRAGLVPWSTHDTKRSGDARARLLALAELAGPFARGLESLRELLASERPGGPARYPGGAAAFASDTRLLAGQLLAIWPPIGAPDDALSVRLRDALIKGAREAKLATSWHAPVPAYEDALAELARASCAREGALFRAAFGKCIEDCARLGATLSLGAVVLRHVLPGYPDCYQGDEVWDYALVDPDNRRPVDFASLAAGLAGLAPRRGLAGELAGSWRDGRVKQLVTARALEARRALRGPLDARRAYLPLAVRGAAATCVVALARDNGSCVAAVTRRPSALSHGPDALPRGDAYRATELALPPGGPTEFVEVCSGRTLTAQQHTLALAEVFAELPVALLRAR